VAAPTELSTLSLHDALPIFVSDVAALDGPCFHAARRGVSEAARRGRWVEVEGFGEIEDEAASAFFLLIGVLRESWTVTQTKYARDRKSTRLNSSHVKISYAV